jgi:glycosyltransferase involved in cell wall biosynthesis
VARDNFTFTLATNWRRDDLPPELRGSRLRVETLALPASTPLNIARQIRALPRLMRGHGAAIEYNVNPVGGFARDWPRVITLHDLYFDVMRSAYKAHHVFWWRIFFALSRRAADRIICVSRQTKADLARYHPSSAARAIVVHSAACLQPDRPIDAARGRYGMFVANVAPNKGADVLVAAMSALEQRGAGVDVLHVGRDDRGIIAAARRRLGTDAGPRALGPVDRDALADLYRGACFLAFPSTREGFGLPVLEAQSFGVPVVATDIPVLREVAGAGALYFHEGDAEGMAAHMHALVADADLWRGMHAAALANAAGFSWDKAASEIEAVFRQLAP